MYCGSCMHDNALARSLNQQGLDVLLVPTYTPIRTDETDVSVDQIFFGGINVYLQQKIPLLRWIPGYLDHFLDNPALIRRVTSRSMDLPPKQLGKLCLSMLHGMHGNQRKEVRRLCQWLKREAQPDAIMFTNMLIGGCIPEIKRTLQVPIIVTLQGDDVFLDELPDDYRHRCRAQIRRLVEYVDGFIVHTEFYREYMQEYFQIPPGKLQVTPLGIDVSEYDSIPAAEYGGTATLGYLARLAPEKGLHHLVKAFIQLKESREVDHLKLRIAGWLGKPNQSYAEEQFARIKAAGLGTDFDYVGSLDRQQKLDFLASIDVLSVPTEFLEPKGLYALEAMACGRPVVQPAQGCFPELIEQTAGGLLFEPANIDDYCEKLLRIFSDHELRKQLGQNARTFVCEQRNSVSMGQSTAALVRRLLTSGPDPVAAYRDD